MYSCVFAILLLVSASGPQRPRRTNAKPNAPLAPSPGQNREVPELESPVRDSKSNPDSTPPPKHNQQNTNQDAVAWYDHGWVVSSIGLLGLFVNAIGLRIIYRQVVSSEASAQAARDSAEAVIVSQRAWVTMTPDRYEREKDTNILYDGSELTRMSFSISNVGLTPAHVSELAIRYRLLTSLNDLPDEPLYGEPRNRIGLLLVREDSANELLSLEDLGGVSVMLLSEMIRSGSKLTYTYGYVKYTDGFGRARETRVGYVFDYLSIPIKGRYRIARRAGPPAYNRAT